MTTDLRTTELRTTGLSDTGLRTTDLSDTNLSDTKRIVGCCSALKMSALFRCLSKAGVPLLMELVSKRTSTLPLLPARSNCTVPSFLSRRPRLTDAPKWLIWKVAKVWLGSMA